MILPLFWLEPSIKFFQVFFLVLSILTFSFLGLSDEAKLKFFQVSGLLDPRNSSFFQVSTFCPFHVSHTPNSSFFSSFDDFTILQKHASKTTPKSRCPNQGSTWLESQTRLAQPRFDLAGVANSISSTKVCWAGGRVGLLARLELGW